MKISASLVLFHNPVAMVQRAIDCFLASEAHGPLVIIDNSTYALFPEPFSSPKVIYHHLGRNIGFGAAHNAALDFLDTHSDLHLIMNPDVYFTAETLPYVYRVMQENPDIGAAMPQIVYPDGTLQQLCKLLPSPMDLIVRRFIPIQSFREALDARYELHGLPQDRMSFVPTLSGCFLFVQTALLQQLRGFDTRYFMYMEDVDLVRRIGDVANTAYIPGARVTHEYSKGSYYNKKLLHYHISSAIKYFMKWGWFFDSARKFRNIKVLGIIKNNA
jgi:GT2 family glycosyltransferase